MTSESIVESLTQLEPHYLGRYGQQHLHDPVKHRVVDLLRQLAKQAGHGLHTEKCQLVSTRLLAATRC